MLKEFYRNPKNGTHWQIYDRKMYSTIGGDKLKHIVFHPFPTLSFNCIKDNIMGDHSFTIEFIWFLWEIRITRYWGEGYRKQMEILKNE